VEGGIQGTLLDLEDGARHLLQALRDGVSVDGAKRNDLQDEHVECALQQVGFLALVGHA
jgi:hypothetical protein